MKFLIIATLVAVACAAPQQYSTIKKITTYQSETSGLAGQGFATQGYAGQGFAGQAYSGESANAAAARFLNAQPAAAAERTLLVRKQHHGQHHAAARSGDAAAEVMELRYDMPDPEHYIYSLKTSNGIEQAEQASLDAGKVQGAYSFVADDGQTYKVEYVADEEGFRPVGAHLPVAPEVPAAILRSLEWNAAHPEEENAKWESDAAQSYVRPAAFNKVTVSKSYLGARSLNAVEGPQQTQFANQQQLQGINYNQASLF